MIYKTLKHKTLPNTFGVIYCPAELDEGGIIQSPIPSLMSKFTYTGELKLYVEPLELENYELVEVELKFLNNE